ncbi:MAG: BON domain-containing protein [Candidatus Omnitrophota bacterium]|jgi:osmotically-inducible protein OsmY
MKTNYQRMFMAAVIALLASSTPLFASEIDQSIESSFKESYVSQTYLKGDAVKAESKDGVVTLSGTINEQSHKGLAQETAQDLPGVKSVDNRLELKAEYPAEKSNEWLALKIKAALLFHRSVSLDNTQVYVEEGIATLRGEAASEAQKELTTEYANVDGIKEVRNEMTVAKAPKNTGQTMKEKIDDASITAQVKMALLFHRSTSVLKTSVATKNGIVTLSGKAKNAAEKDLVTKLVSDIHGVNRVVNNMNQE